MWIRFGGVEERLEHLEAALHRRPVVSGVIQLYPFNVQRFRDGHCSLRRTSSKNSFVEYKNIISVPLDRAHREE